MSKNHRAKVQFTGYMDTRGSEWEGVGPNHVEEAIDDMDEDELKRWLKVNMDAVLADRKKD
jgi:hypothetical protein